MGGLYWVWGTLGESVHWQDALQCYYWWHTYLITTLILHCLTMVPLPWPCKFGLVAGTHKARWRQTSGGRFPAPSVGKILLFTIHISYAHNIINIITCHTFYILPKKGAWAYALWWKLPGRRVGKGWMWMWMWMYVHMCCKLERALSHYCLVQSIFNVWWNKICLNQRGRCKLWSLSLLNMLQLGLGMATYDLIWWGALLGEHVS